MIKRNQTTALSARGTAQATHPLAGSWKSAAGMMRKHKRRMERYIAAVRKEWR